MPTSSNVYKKVNLTKLTTPKESNLILHKVSYKDLTFLKTTNA